MELYNPTTEVFNFAAFEKDIMVNADVEVAELDTTELKAKMTCASVKRGWAAWVKKVKASKKYRTATRAQRKAFWKKVFTWVLKFDAQKKCGWVKAWKAYCKAAHAKLMKFIKKAKKHPKYLKATKAQRAKFWRAVAKKVLKWNRKAKCHWISKTWAKQVKVARKFAKKH